MCPPKTKKPAVAPDPSEQAVAEKLSIGAAFNPDKPTGRKQTRTSAASSSLNIAGTSSGLRI